jgi:hypothetical protein
MITNGVIATYSSVGMVPVNVVVFHPNGIIIPRYVNLVNCPLHAIGMSMSKASTCSQLPPKAKLTTGWG